MKLATSTCLAVFALVAFALLISTVPAHAKRAPGPTVLKSPDEAEPSERRGKQRISLETGAPLALFQVDHQLVPSTPEVMARQYLREAAETLHLRSNGLEDLQLHATRSRLGGLTVRFKQQFEGIPVYKAEIAISINNDDKVMFVANTYKPGVDLATTIPSIAQDRARQVAHEYLGIKGALHFDRTQIIVYHNQGVSRLAYRVRAEPKAQPRGDWEVLVDAMTGEVFKAVDIASYVEVDGSGNVFDPDPLSSATATYGDPGFVDGLDADTAQLSAETINMTLQDIDLTGGTHSLVGPWAEITDWDSPFKGLFSQASSAWSFTRSADAFEAANTYYQIDNYMRYMNITLGLNVRPFQYPGGVQYDPSGFSGQDNSAYFPGTGRLTFGEGGVDDAEDADVIIHELGHGIHDWVTSGSASSAIGEGTGDYFAQSYSRSLGNWLPSDPAYHYVFSWDGHNPFWNGRTTDYFGIYPDDLTGSAHTDGQIWATCNMLIWDEIGREQTDKAMLEGLAMTGSGTNQEDAAQAVLQAAIDMSYPTVEQAAISQIYQSCGYVVPDIDAEEIFLDGFESGDTAGWI